MAKGPTFQLPRLYPVNGHARKVVLDRRNVDFCVINNIYDIYLDVGLVPSSPNGERLATFGRRGDIHVDIPDSKCDILCAFIQKPWSFGSIMLKDLSPSHSTQVFSMSQCNIPGGNSMTQLFPFEDGRSREVYVGEHVNPVIGIGGPDNKLILFKLEWPDHHNPFSITEKRRFKKDVARLLEFPISELRQISSHDNKREVSPLTELVSNKTKQPRTTSLVNAVLPSAMTPNPAFPSVLPSPLDRVPRQLKKLKVPPQDPTMSAFQSVGLSVPQLPNPTPCRDKPIRFHQQKRLGAGTYGEVHRCINVDTSEAIAVKFLHQGPDNDRDRKYCQRESDILSCVQHPRIVRFIGSQNWDEDQPQIILELMDGSLADLLKNGSYDMGPYPLSQDQLVHLVLHHVLEGLEYLHAKGILHRDLKPGNILYTCREGVYRFCIGDFGSSNYANVARTNKVGTPVFMAPEVQQDGKHHSPKADIWSLFITVLYILNQQEIYQHRSEPMVVEEITKAINTFPLDEKVKELVRDICDMVSIDPDSRPSATDLLRRLYSNDVPRAGPYPANKQINPKQEKTKHR